MVTSLTMAIGLHAQAAKVEEPPRPPVVQANKAPDASRQTVQETLGSSGGVRDSGPVVSGSSIANKVPDAGRQTVQEPVDSSGGALDSGPVVSGSSETPAGEQPPPPAEAVNPLQFNYKVQILAYGTNSGIQANGIFNPQNRLANIPKWDSRLAVRPDLSLKYSIFSISARPRLDYDQPLKGAGHYAKVYIQEWEVRLQPHPTLTISHGRQVLLWGPAMSVPASNPFFTDNGRNTPLLEVGARDFARVIWQPNTHWSLAYLANTNLGRGTTGPLPFRRTGALKVDFSGNSLSGSFIYSNALARPFGPGKFIGGYVQKTIGQALRLYVEGSAQSGTPFLAPAPAQNPVGWQWMQAQLRGPMKPRTIVSGLAYTDRSAGTWTGEYIYNASGYDSILAANFYAMAQDLSRSFLQQSALTPLAAAELAEAREPGGGLLLRRHYAFGQYQRNGLFQHLNVVLRYTISANDRSGQSVAYLTWDAGDHLQLFGLFGGLNGATNTEFARYLHYQAQFGFRIYFH